MQCASCEPTSVRKVPSSTDHRVARPSSETQIRRSPSGSQATELMSSVCRARTLTSVAGPSWGTRQMPTVLSAEAVARRVGSAGFQAEELTRRRWRRVAASVGWAGSVVFQTITVPS